jgi:hypothetical protein
MCVLITFPLQQLLHESASMLHCTYIACLVLSFLRTSQARSRYNLSRPLLFEVVTLSQRWRWKFKPLASCPWRVDCSWSSWPLKMLDIRFLRNVDIYLSCLVLFLFFIFYFVLWPANAQLFHKLLHSTFRHYRVILRELVSNTLPSYTSIGNAAVGNTIYH